MVRRGKEGFFSDIIIFLLSQWSSDWIFSKLGTLKINLSQFDSIYRFIDICHVNRIYFPSTSEARLVDTDQSAWQLRHC